MDWLSSPARWLYFSVQMALSRRFLHKKKKKKSTLESEVFSIVEKSLKTALDKALDDILKDWK
jgi:hypothetical protein